MFTLVMTANFPKLIINNKPQMEKSQKAPSSITIKKLTCVHTIFKFQETKDKYKYFEGNQRQGAKMPYLYKNEKS